MNEMDENANKDEYYEIIFKSNDQNFNGRVRIKKEFKDIENEQKNQNDKNAQYNRTHLLIKKFFHLF